MNASRAKIRLPLKCILEKPAFRYHVAVAKNDNHHSFCATHHNGVAYIGVQTTDLYCICGSDQTFRRSHWPRAKNLL